MKRIQRLTSVAAAVTLACSGAAVSAQQQSGNGEAPDDAMSQAGEQYSRNTAEGMTSNARPGQALSSEMAEANNLVQFRKALEKSGIAGALRNGQAYTLFAPTDDAFDALQKEETSALMDEQNVEQLRKVLRSHIVAGKVDAAQARSIKAAKVLTGDTLPLSVDGDKLHVANAAVVKSDIQSGSLTIHTIDKVIDADDISTMEEEEAEE